MVYPRGVTILRSLAHSILAVALCGAAHAQLATSLRLSKRNYLTGERVVAAVSITNHAGRELTFYGNGRMPWLQFIMKDRKGDPVSPRGVANFGKMKIPAGATMTREVDLAEQFILSEQGNYSVTGVVRMPGSDSAVSSTNRELFTQSAGILYWKQKVGLPGRAGQTREFRLLNFSGDKKEQIYAQIVDGSTGRNVRTFLLGDVLMMRKPVVTVDKNQKMHVMFLATPTMWVHCQIDTDGRLVDRKIHQRGDSGDPQLLTYGDGTVRVGNSIPYDPAAAAEAKAKVRKASDRPPGAY